MFISIGKNFICWMLLYIGFYLQSNAQQDTLFINELGAHVARANASYYRIITNLNKGSEITDFDLNHVCRRKVNYTNPQAVIKEGSACYYDSHGNKIEEGFYSKGFKIGNWTTYFTGGKKVKEQINYNLDKTYYFKSYDTVSGKLNDEGMINQYELKTGIWKSYYFKSDSLEWLYNYKDGKKEGEQIQYYKNGLLKRTEVYVKNQFKKGKLWNEKGQEIKYYPSFEYPQPPERIRQFLYTRVACFESTLRTHDMELKCKINSDGTMSDLAILHCKNPICEQEIKNELRKLKKWKPAKVEGKPIDFRYEYKLKYYVPKD